MIASGYSVVVISRDRPSFLARLFEYYAGRGFTAPLLLGDGSGAASRGEVAGVVDRYRGRLQVSYTAYPETAPVLERLQWETAKVSTPYIAWAGDDDFLVPRALQAACEHLGSHEDVAAVTGKALQFSVKGDEARGTLAGVGEYRQTPCEQGRASDRLLAEAHQGTAYTYALRRTDAVKRNLARFDTAFWPDDRIGYYFFEILDGLLTSLDGRIAMLKDLLLLRQTHARSTAASGRATHKLHLVVLHPRWPEFSRKAIDTLAESLIARQRELSPAQSAEYAELALCTRIGALLLKGRATGGGQPPETTRSARSLLRQLLPDIARGKSLLIERLKLNREDRNELAQIVRLIESGNAPGHHAARQGART